MMSRQRHRSAPRPFRLDGGSDSFGKAHLGGKVNSAGYLVATVNPSPFLKMEAAVLQWRTRTSLIEEKDCDFHSVQSAFKGKPLSLQCCQPLVQRDRTQDMRAETLNK